MTYQFRVIPADEIARALKRSKARLSELKPTISPNHTRVLCKSCGRWYATSRVKPHRCAGRGLDE